ncbi:S8 family serine peptidase [Streptomyces varsoviensis]|uniref:S8 family serine peptidase n=1 Tax=Streptomyces varsoviensis TaxID=67373 RepID=UPI0004C4A22C|nr:S8 family serine peptidase [Streptomyces varsoviensis]
MRIQVRKLRHRVVSATALCGVGLVAMGGTAPAATAADIRSRQWYLQDMQAENMWKVSKGEGVTVAVIDSGINAELPELRGQVLAGADFNKNPTGAHKDEEGHGSNMASLIAGTGAEGGVQGLAPEAKILPLKVKLHANSAVIDEMLSKAVRYAADHNARVINMSLGGEGVPSYYSKVQAAVTYALKKDILIFAAVGNNGDKKNLPEYPAALPGVVGVGAMDRQGSVAKWSTHGSQVALVAFGDELPERCMKREGICTAGGTSQASAIAAGSAALIRAKHPEWTNNQVLRVMMETAGKPANAKMPSEYLGYGSIRPRKVLVDGEGDPGPADVNPLTNTKNPAPAAPSAVATEGKDGEKAPAPSAESVEAKTETSRGGHTTVWLAIGAGVVVLVGLAVAFTLKRRRGSA